MFMLVDQPVLPVLFVVLLSCSLVFAIEEPTLEKSTQTTAAEPRAWWALGGNIAGGLLGLEWTTVDDYAVWIFELLAQMVGAAWHVVRSNGVIQALLTPAFATTLWSVQGWINKKLEQFFLFQIAFSDPDQVEALQQYLALHHQDASNMSISRKDSSTAGNGFAKALYDIGEMYDKGTEKHVEKSKEEAVLWYQKAFSQGSLEAKDALSKIDPSFLVKIEKQERAKTAKQDNKLAELKQLKAEGVLTKEEYKEHQLAVMKDDSDMANSTFHFRSQLDSKPCAIIFAPSASNSGLSSFIWMSSTGEGSWLSFFWVLFTKFPLIQIKGANVESALWQSMPEKMKQMYMEMKKRVMKVLQYNTNEYGEPTPQAAATNDLIVSAMRWNAHLVHKCAHDAVLLHKKRSTTRLTLKKVVYGAGGKACWTRLRKPPRPRHTVYLCDEADKSITTITKFFSSREHYEHCELQFQRVFLLYGPPGCGKSSYLAAIATTFKLPL
jgi:hypothetical protein